jgi:hypothetical protein
MSLVVRAGYWHSSDPGLNPQQRRPLYLWMYVYTPNFESAFGGDIALYRNSHLFLFYLFGYMYTPSAMSILGMDMCAF